VLLGVMRAGYLPSDNLSMGVSGPSGQFALRYDFGDSLSRAIQSAKNDMTGKPDGLYMKSRKKAGSPIAVMTGAENKTQPSTSKAESTSVAPAVASPADSPSTGISSASYEEIVNKWCFVGIPGPHSASRPSTVQEQMGGKLHSGPP
jgi:hypothetical protein